MAGAPKEMWVLPRRIVNRILGHAQRSAPQECVGVLSGRGRQVSGWHPLTNTRQDTHSFLADPREQLRLFKELREQGHEVVAIYHSHPDAPPVPSPRDREEAYYPEALYLIVSLATEGALEMRGYLWQEGQFVLQDLSVEER